MLFWDKKNVQGAYLKTYRITSLSVGIRGGTRCDIKQSKKYCRKIMIKKAILLYVFSQLYVIKHIC